MNKERILELADIIENNRLPLVEFNMDRYAGHAPHIHPECGTLACIAGYAVCAAYGNREAKAISGYLIALEAKRILDLSEDQAEKLFWGKLDANQEEAVCVLRHLAETGQVDWNVVG